MLYVTISLKIVYTYSLRADIELSQSTFLKSPLHEICDGCASDDEFLQENTPQDVLNVSLNRIEKFIKCVCNCMCVP